MKKFVTIGLSAIFGLACLGAAACGENGGGDGASFDHVALVSDKIETDEEWNRAMWDTLVALADFEGEDDATKTYNGWWYPDNSLLYDNAAGNYKVEIHYTNHEADEALPISCQIEVDGNKLHGIAKGNAKAYSKDMTGEGYIEFDENRDRKSVVRESDETGTTMGEWKENRYFGSDLLEILDDNILMFLDFSHIDMYWEKEASTDLFPNPFRRTGYNVWDQESLEAMGILPEKDYRSILDVAKYDEAKGGYTVTDKAVLRRMIDKHFDDSEIVKGCTFKFKDGKLAAVLVGDTDYIKITYGGQKVEFPNGLPW